MGGESAIRVATGLPNGVPGTSGEQLVEFARRAEARGFSSLGAIDRLVYQCFEPLTALAAAAAVTERIGLCTSVLLGPLRDNAALLASHAASVQALSAGRLTLGIGLGGRGDDFEVAGVDPGNRGARLDAMLEEMLMFWGGGKVGPRIEARPKLIVGGLVDASLERAAQFADGWVAGGTPPDAYARMVEGLDGAWAKVGRADRPYRMALVYYSLGPAAEQHASSYLTGYYGWLGAEAAGQIAASAATDPETVRAYVAAYEQAGCDEIILFPCSSDPDQVELLADAAGLCGDEIPVTTKPPSTDIE